MGTFAMSIRIVCKCGKKMDAQDTFVGRNVRCPKCSSKIHVTGFATDAAARPDSEPKESAHVKRREPVPAVGHAFDWTALPLNAEANRAHCPNCLAELAAPNSPNSAMSCPRCSAVVNN